MLNSPIYSIGQIAAAGDLSPNTIRQWDKDGLLLRQKDDRIKAPEGAGLPRFYSGRMALMIAIMGRLSKIGVPPRLARDAGIHFAHLGDEQRSPGELFGGGAKTVLIVDNNVPRVVKVTEATKAAAMFRDLTGHDPQTPVLYFPLDELVNEVTDKLEGSART
jgi:hypothetical protein